MLSVRQGYENSDNKALVQVTEDTNFDRQKWQIIPLSDGNYKLKPKSAEGSANDWCAAAGSGIGDINGRNVEQRKFVNDTSYIDEWQLTLFLGELQCWYDDEVDDMIGMWTKSPVIYTTSFGTDRTFNLDDYVTNARTQWNNALGLSMSETSTESEADIKVYGGTKSELAENTNITISSSGHGATTPEKFQLVGVYKYENKIVACFEILSATVALVNDGRNFAKYRKTMTHEMGHALGFRGHIGADKAQGVMRSGNFDDYTLTYMDYEHLKQVY